MTSASPEEYLDSVLSILSEGAESCQAEIFPKSEEGRAVLHAHIRYPDGSLLAVVLGVDMAQGHPAWEHYSFHYMDADGRLLFRYDNAPYHPLPHFPHHKHLSENVIVAGRPPWVHGLRREIEELRQKMGGGPAEA